MVKPDMLSAQVAVLGSMLIEPKLVGETLERVQEEDFLTPRCRMVYQAIRSAFVEGKPADIVTIRSRLGAKDGDGWTEYLLELMDLTPTAANIWEYVTILREQAREAKVVELAKRMLESPDRAQEYIAQLNGLMVERQGVQRMDMAQMLLAFADRHTGNPVPYMTWGLPKVDAGTYVEMGDMVILGGYPSTGKTALAVSMAYHQAKDHRVGFYSLETNQYKLADRLMANLAWIEMPFIKRNQISEEGWQRVAERSESIRARNLDLIEASGMSVQDIQADAMARRYEIVYIDYLQLIEPESRKINRTEQVSGISRGLQQLAHGTGRLVVALSQLSRAEYTGKKEPVEPTMSDLRESGQIEQDADAIMLIYLEDPTRPEGSRRVLKVAKNKEGTRGRIYLVFDGQYQRFRESALDEPAPAKPKRREPEYKQAALYDLPGSEKVPWEEDGYGDKQGAAADPAGGGGAAAPSAGQAVPPAGGAASGDRPGPGGGPADRSLPF